MRFIAFITLSRWEEERKVEPPIIRAEEPAAVASLAIFDAAEGVTFSGSISVICIAPSPSILSLRYFSTFSLLHQLFFRLVKSVNK